MHELKTKRILFFLFFVSSFCFHGFHSFVQTTRQLATAASASKGTYKPKTIYEAWCSDSGVRIFVVVL